MREAGDRIVVVGATGFIGSHLAGHLAARGLEVLGIARTTGTAARRMPAVRWASVDLATAAPGDWSAHMQGAAAVVNCAGALQHGPSDDLAGTHDRGLRALIEAAEAAGVPRFIHFSAMGVDEATPTAFSRSKLAGDEALMASRLDWVILRPSVVIGAAAYGGSALIRGLAALPVLPVMPETGLLRPVALDDVVATVDFFLQSQSPARVAVDLAGPDVFTFDELVGAYRRWLGWRPARLVTMPAWLAGAAYKLGDLAGRLGWRPAIRTTAQKEIARGAAREAGAWQTITGIRPSQIGALRAASPASVQERWFAALYLTKPLALISLVIFWVGSGLASLGPGYATGIAMMQHSGAGAVAPLAVIGGGLADLVIGLGLAWRRSARPALLGGIAVALFYAVAGTILTPWLWLDPLAPLLKIAPVVALHLVALAILDDR